MDVVYGVVYGETSGVLMMIQIADTRPSKSITDSQSVRLLTTISYKYNDKKETGSICYYMGIRCRVRGEYATS